MDPQLKNYACMLLKPLSVEIQDMGMPTVGNDDVLVKVESTGLCGSDV
jgi:D-xylulose reductase